ncbi:hypothetical protein GCM10025864_23190 [Luteimicrobium album]|uniref:Uncharacterized protein n=1 Tax=Luteimicrobium album TaxID=1054550 RepID=A0ABQ6I238_9MICO|nr:hypothetical protein [Luteimicrobium album]GMA24560.1 hypothetical protein GCM10025864_23190 [Luteimicrobium album]
MARPARSVARLETQLRLERAAVDGRSYSVSARLDAVLDDGRHVVLLDDRGWSTSGPPGTSDRLTVAELEATARVVVGPDEPMPGRTRKEEAELHWSALADVLARAGIAATGAGLARLPHDVVLDERLLARVRR